MLTALLRRSALVALAFAAWAPQAAAHFVWIQAQLAESGIEHEYAVLRDAQTLLGPGPMMHPDGPNPACRLLVAARVGGVRLIDNTPWHGRPTS